MKSFQNGMAIFGGGGIGQWAGIVAFTFAGSRFGSGRRDGV